MQRIPFLSKRLYKIPSESAGLIGGMGCIIENREYANEACFSN